MFVLSLLLLLCVCVLGATITVLLQETILETEFDGEASKFTMRQVGELNKRFVIFVACFPIKQLLPDTSLPFLSGVARATDASCCRQVSCQPPPAYRATGAGCPLPVGLHVVYSPSPS